MRSLLQLNFEDQIWKVKSPSVVQDAAQASTTPSAPAAAAPANGALHASDSRQLPAADAQKQPGKPQGIPAMANSGSILPCFDVVIKRFVGKCSSDAIRTAWQGATMKWLLLLWCHLKECS